MDVWAVWRVIGIDMPNQNFQFIIWNNFKFNNIKHVYDSCVNLSEVCQ